MSDFKLRPAPGMCGDDTINQLWEGDLVSPTSIAELFFSTTKRHDDFEFEPAGDGGWYCYSKNYSGPPDPKGHGPTQKDALLDYLDQGDL